MNALLLLLGLVASSSALEHWVVGDASNHSCIIIDTDAHATVRFDDGNGTVYTHTVAINKTLDVTGDCNAIYNNESAQNISVSFYPNGVTASTASAWILDLVFGTDEKAHLAFKLIDFKLTTSPQDSLKGSKTKIFRKADAAEFSVQAADVNAYKCSTTNIALIDQSYIELKNLKAIAFAKIDGGSFPGEQVYQQCALDSHTSDIVPIIVGACLAGLVIIVLVAYLIGRARAKRQGYASV